MTTLRFMIEKEPRAPGVVARGPSRIARQLALAYQVEQFVDEGSLKSYAEAAQRLGITRARMSQIVGLLLLPIEMQEAVLFGDVEVSERGMRAT